MGLHDLARLSKGVSAHEKPDFSIEPKSASDCVVVFHEVWGLVEHTTKVCKRVSKLGFAAIAPNLYRGYDDVLTPANIQKLMEDVWQLSLDERRDKQKVARTLAEKGSGEEAKKAASVLYDQEFRDSLLRAAISSVENAHSRFDRITTLGFCLGGGLSLKVATRARSLTSAISFYGEPPNSADLGEISVPILAIHASKDEIINEKVPAFVQGMLLEGKDLTLKTYPSTKHGFFNDSRDEVYNRGAASDAWDITRWFLERTLGKH